MQRSSLPSPLCMTTFVSGSISSTKRKAATRKPESRRNVPAVPGNKPQLEPSKSGVAMAMVKFPIQLAAVVMETAVPATHKQEHNITSMQYAIIHMQYYTQCLPLIFKGNISLATTQATGLQGSRCTKSSGCSNLRNLNKAVMNHSSNGENTFCK